MSAIWQAARFYIGPIFAAFVGGYALTWGVAALSMIGLTAAGVSFHTAETSIMLLAFPFFLSVFLWSFISRYPAAVMSLQLLIGLAMLVSAWLLQQSILS